MEWLLVTNRSGAEFYSLDRRGNLELHRRLNNPMGRDKRAIFLTDSAGVSRARFYGNQSTHKLTGEKDPRDYVASDFAREVTDYIRSILQRNKLNSLHIYADPKFVGYLRKNVDKKIKERLEWHVKDLLSVDRSQWPKILGFKRLPDKDSYVHSNRTAYS